MLSESSRLSVAFLRAVLAGETYDAVAAAHGLTRTAIEHRVKRLAKQLQREVGIEGLSPAATGYAHKLREHRPAVEEAMSRFEDGVRARVAPPTALSDNDVHVMLHRAGLRSPMALRDIALVHTVLATGARPLEIARLEIADYLLADGTVRSCSEMRAAVSVNRNSRPLFFCSAPAVKAIDAYLGHRLAEAGHKPDTEALYRGFAADDRLFFNDFGEPYLVHCHNVGGRPRFLCRQMLDTFRKIFKRIDMHGISALTLRRTVACRLSARGADEEQIGLLLGITEKQAVRELLPRRPDVVELMTDLYTESESPPFSSPVTTLKNHAAG